MKRLLSRIVAAHRQARGLQGKLNTEAMLDKRGVNWTSVRPVYIYGPLNYNPVEEHIFHRLAAGRPVCVPGSGQQARPHSKFALCGWIRLAVRCDAPHHSWSAEQQQLYTDQLPMPFDMMQTVAVTLSYQEPCLCFLLRAILTASMPECLQVTQLGHVKDLATAFKLILDNPKAEQQIYNISGER